MAVIRQLVVLQEWSLSEVPLYLLLSVFPKLNLVCCCYLFVFSTTLFTFRMQCDCPIMRPGLEANACSEQGNFPFPDSVIDYQGNAAHVLPQVKSNTIKYKYRVSRHDRDFYSSPASLSL